MPQLHCVLIHNPNEDVSVDGPYDTADQATQAMRSIADHIAKGSGLTVHPQDGHDTPTVLIGLDDDPDGDQDCWTLYASPLAPSVKLDA